MFIKFFLFVITLCIISLLQQRNGLWIADNGDGTYRNPVIHADYSDPDVIRVGEDYYMTSSSFTAFPGLPILHSKDLVNWELIGHAAPEYPVDDFNIPQHGNGIWAPSIRFHKKSIIFFSGILITEFL